MRIITALLFVLVLAGCAHRGEQMDEDALRRIAPGVTTRAEMVQMFGNPLSQSFGTEGKLSMIWYYVHVGPFGTNMKQQNLTVLFDQQDRVERFSLVDDVNKRPVNIASPPPTPQPQTQAAPEPMSEKAYKDAKIQQLMKEDISYEEYQRRYREIMDH
jgi:outer membrane protein assembly factor BamE (lipoprotein component of BamABCDE complex)